MTVSFHLPDDAPETPVDVYDERLGLVGRCLSTEELTTMTPGQYFAIARPFGEPPLAAVFDVGEGAHTSVRLVPQPVAAEPEATIVFDHDFWPETAGGRQPLSEAGEVGGQSWNLHVAMTSWALPSSQHGSSRPLDWVDVRLSTHTGATQCCILRREAWQHLRPTVRRDLGGQVALVMQLRHPIARELLAFLGSGRIAHAEALCRSSTLEPRRLLGARLSAIRSPPRRAPSRSSSSGRQTGSTMRSKAFGTASPGSRTALSLTRSGSRDSTGTTRPSRRSAS
jgi:hypothetical protein